MRDHAKEILPIHRKHRVTSHSFSLFQRRSSKVLKVALLMLFAVVLYIEYDNVQSLKERKGVNTSRHSATMGGGKSGRAWDPAWDYWMCQKQCGDNALTKTVSLKSSVPVIEQLEWSRVPADADYEKLVTHYERRYNRSAPIRLRSWYDYAKDHGCPVMAEYDLVHELLLPFRKVGGISTDMIEAAKQLPNVVAVSISQGRLSYSSGASSDYFATPVLQRIAHLLPDMELVINYHDEPRVVWPKNAEANYATLRPYVDQQLQQLTDSGYGRRLNPSVVSRICQHVPHVAKNAPYHGFFQAPASLEIHYGLIPVFSYSNIKDCFIDLLIPSFYAIAEVNEGVTDTPTWENRKSQIFWRGTAHSTYNNDSWSLSEAVKFNHRTRFAMHYHDNSIVDAGLTGVVQCLQKSCHNLESVLHFKPTATHADHYNFKYLWDMDGNGISGRFIRFLKNSHSLVFKAKLFGEWLDNFIKPFEHYVPFHFDFGVSNATEEVADRPYYQQPNADKAIISAFNWAEKHPEVVKKMVEHASDYSRAFLGLNGMDCYVFRLLIEYESLIIK